MKNIIKKIITYLMLITLTMTYFIPIESIYADEAKKYVKIGTLSTELKVRPNPSDSTALAWIQTSQSGSTYEYSGSAPAGNGCVGEWYKIKYGSSEGYICSDVGIGPYLEIVNYYINPNFNTTFDRPWTSPKKAIVGGAKFITNGYVTKGQDTAYLKKFNVSPNAYYSHFTNQYMANLRAPASEVSMLYQALADNDLLKYNFIFEIPVYKNMPNNTYDEKILKTYNNNIPDSFMVETDSDFEKTIDGFPESYRPYLRYIHSVHPDWIFRPLNINYDFDYVVSREKKVSSIQGNYRQWYNNPSECEFTYENGYCQTETGWYIADDQTVAFYVDSRNFLSERYIFMFNKISYSEDYNEKAVQNILNGTFMSGMSLLDNQSYASIFVEAGRLSGVSPLYLASLARIESGVKISNTTSGAAFDYQGYSYSGLYNFFNIGAYSGAENPALQGLVYANGGAGGNSFSSDSIDFLLILKLTQVGNYVKGYSNETKISTVKSQVGNRANVTVRNSNNEIKKDDSMIGTGDKIEISTNTSSGNFVYIMYGDLNGDGKINSADLLSMRQHLLKTKELNGAFKESAELNNDGKINSADLLQIRKHLLGQVTIGG